MYVLTTRSNSCVQYELKNITKHIKYNVHIVNYTANYTSLETYEFYCYHINGSMITPKYLGGHIL